MQNNKQVLSDFLSKNTYDMQQFSLEQFKTWLSHHIQNKRNDVVFLLRCQIRDIEKKNHSVLTELRRNVEQAWIQWQQSANFARLEELATKKNNHMKALIGLRKAAEESKGQKEKEIQIKIQKFTQALEEILREEEMLLQKTPEKSKWEFAQKKLYFTKNQLGLQQLEETLKIENTKIGRNSSYAGANFERACYQAIQNNIIPIVSHMLPVTFIHILRNVTLGCARGEMDYVLVQKKRNDDVLVLGIVEAKRNPNDIASSFFLRQENIAWFCGDITGYDPTIYRTKEFQKGHFDRMATHVEHDEEFSFTKNSFRLFSRDKTHGYYLEHLFFITVDRPLSGVGVDELGRIMYYVSTDICFDDTKDEYLQNLLKKIQQEIAPQNTHYVLQLYNTDELARRIMFLEKSK